MQKLGWLICLLDGVLVLACLAIMAEPFIMSWLVNRKKKRK